MKLARLSGRVARFTLVTAAAMVLTAATASRAEQDQRIGVSPDYPRYWQMNGEPVVLIGGSKRDSLFQVEGLEEHLDLLASVGGNYVRNTMSSRNEGDEKPFKKVEGGYDLDQFNEAYWERFERFLQLTAERGIVVQIEVWATFDYYLEFWDDNPFNPANTVSYTARESGLRRRVRTHPTQTENDFFRSTPPEQNNELLLRYQTAFVDKMLEHSLKYGHVLYCMDNETSVSPEWGWHWAKHIRERAEQAGVTVAITEMWDPWDLNHDWHRYTFDYPEIYDFVDVSQNNHQKGQAHWDNAQRQRARIAEQPRPLNNVKIYGADGGRYGNTRDGLERFWRNVIGGMASQRFHRPDAGVGLNEQAQAHLRSARMLLDALAIWRCEPGNERLSDRGENEAYLTAEPGRQYAVYFPDGGEVTLDVSEAEALSGRWLNIAAGEWGEPWAVEAGADAVRLTTPGEGHWVVVLGISDL